MARGPLFNPPRTVYTARNRTGLYMQTCIVLLTVFLLPFFNFLPIYYSISLVISFLYDIFAHFPYAGGECYNTINKDNLSTEVEHK